MDTCKGKVCAKLSGPVVKDGRAELFEVTCIEHRCAHYQHLIGRAPQTGKLIDAWDCAFKWTNELLIENAQQIRQHAAAIESMRNEARKDAETISQGMAGIAKAMTLAAGAALRETPRLPNET